MDPGIKGVFERHPLPRLLYSSPSSRSLFYLLWKILINSISRPIQLQQTKLLFNDKMPRYELLG